MHSLTLLGSHDTPRWASVSGDLEWRHVGLAWRFTSPGVPSVFAGDGLGLEAAGLDRCAWIDASDGWRGVRPELDHDRLAVDDGDLALPPPRHPLRACGVSPRVPASPGPATNPDRRLPIAGRFLR